MDIMRNDNLDTQRRTLWTAYLLYVLLFTAPVGFVISLMKAREFRKLPEAERDALPEALATLRSHHEWLVRTFIATTVLAMMGLGTLYYGIGWVIWSVTGLWWIYRLARGVVSLLGTRPMPVWI